MVFIYGIPQSTLHFYSGYPQSGQHLGKSFDSQWMLIHYIHFTAPHVYRDEGDNAEGLIFVPAQ